MANWVPATSIKNLFAAPPAPAPVATTPGPQASPFPPAPTAVAAPPAAPPQGSTGWQARVQQAKTTWAGWTPGKKAAVAGTVAGALALFVLLPCCLTVSFLAGAFGSSPPPPGGSRKVGTSKPLFGGFPAHPGDNAANPPEADPTPADASSDYKDGYQTGLSLGRQKVDLYRGMSAGEKAEFHKVFNEMADQFDENYQQARHSAGPNNGGTQAPARHCRRLSQGPARRRRRAVTSVPRHSGRDRDHSRLPVRRQRPHAVERPCHCNHAVEGPLEAPRPAV